MALPRKPISNAQMEAAQEFISGKETTIPDALKPKTKTVKEIPINKSDNTGKTVTYNAVLPFDVHATAKILAIKKGITLKAYIIEAINEKNEREK